MPNTTVTPIAYICACGCRVLPEYIVRTKTKEVDKERRLNRRCCPVHADDPEGSKVVENVMICELCGGEFHGVIAHYCPSCRSEHKKEVMRVYGRKYYKSNPEKYLRGGGASKHKKMEVDGKRDSMDCVNFGGFCGKICVWPEHPCRARKSKLLKRRAA